MNAILRRFGVPAVIAVLVLGAVAPATAAAGPPTLTGEIAAAQGRGAGSVCENLAPDPFVCVDVPGGSTTKFQLHCASDGSGTFTFEAAGAAIGPYIGSFVESGVVRIGPPFNPSDPASFGPILEFNASFTIDSPTGRVEGRKFITESTGQGNCSGAPGGSGRSGTVSANLLARYEATIKTGSGTFSDAGRSRVFASGANPDSTGAITFASDIVQNFTSDLTEPIAQGPATVTLSPPDAVNDVGTSHTVTATVKDVTGGSVANATVLFSTSGSTTASGSCTTNAGGQCSFSYVGPQLPGADIITACADSNGNGTRDTGEPCAEATKAWILPTSTAGQTTGGGQVLNAAGNDKIAFGYNAKSTANGLQGNCTVVDPSPTTNVKIKCLDVTSLVQSGTHATFFGNATMNGTATTYRIDVDDLGEPGAGRDTFKIQTTSGYTAGGTITNGNIQVHN